MTSNDNYASLTVAQLKKILQNADEDKEIRVWVEFQNKDGNTYLQGRQLYGIMESPDDKYLSLIARQYPKQEE